MSFWIELHCDYKKPSGRWGQCANEGHDYSMAMARNQSSAHRVMTLVCDEAVKRGWRKIAKKWACPYCVGVLRKNHL